MADQKPKRAPRLHAFTAEEISSHAASLQKLSDKFNAAAQAASKLPQTTYQIDGGVNAIYALHWLAKILNDVTGQQDRSELPLVPGLTPTGPIPPLPPPYRNNKKRPGK